jgi:hypothetical protein
MEEEIAGESTVRLTTRRSRGIVSDDEFLAILGNCPERLKLKEWRVVYSLRRDGASYRTLLNRCRDRREIILLIKPSSCRVIGGFVSGEMHIQQYYSGNADTFVFSVDNRGIEVYRWTGANRFFLYCSENGFGIGGGSNYAIHVDERLRMCSTGYCETFGNPALVNQDVFECLDIEVWGFDD